MLAGAGRHHLAAGSSDRLIAVGLTGKGLVATIIAAHDGGAEGAGRLRRAQAAAAGNNDSVGLA